MFTPEHGRRSQFYKSLCLHSRLEFSRVNTIPISLLAEAGRMMRSLLNWSAPSAAPPKATGMLTAAARHARAN
jgi:hypothetical protein